MASLLTPNYQDYVSNFQQFGQRDESGTQAAGSPMSESDWNALTDAQKWGLLGMGNGGVNTPYGDSPYGLTVNSSDPRYSQLSPQFGGGNSALQFSFDPNGNGLRSEPVQRFSDPNLVHTQGGVTGYSVGNETPGWFNYVNQQNKMTPAEMAMIFGPILGAAAYAGGTALGAFGDAGGTAGTTAGTAGAIDTGDLGALAPSGFGGTGGTAGAVSGGTSLGALGINDAPMATDFTTGTATSMVPASSAFAGTPYAGLLDGGVSGLLSHAGTWAMNNPLRAIGLAQTAYGLLGGGSHGSSSGGGGGSKGGSGGSGTPFSTQQQFYTNPYLAAQIQRGYGQ